MSQPTGCTKITLDNRINKKQGVIVTYNSFDRYFTLQRSLSCQNNVKLVKIVRKVVMRYFTEK